MIPLPNNYQDPHGLTLPEEAVVVVQYANFSRNENKSVNIGSNGAYVPGMDNKYSRIEYRASIFISPEAFAEGKKGIPFYGPNRADMLVIENPTQTDDLIAACESHIQDLF